MNTHFVQVIDLKPVNAPNNSKTLILNQENLTKILQGAGERPVSIISVVGQPRKEKSILLFLITQCLEALEVDECDLLDLENRKALPNFQSVSETDRNSFGILMWNKPFIIKQQGTEVAVLLMDTQINYDDGSLIHNMNSLTNFSLLCSSCTILNVSHDNENNVLNSLETTTQFGEFLLKSYTKYDEDKIWPFQKLILLVHDYIVSSQFPDENTSHKESMLKTKDKDTPIIMKTKSILNQCFNEIGFFQTSYSETVAGFSGSPTELHTTITNGLQEIVNSILNLNTLPVKYFLGNAMTAKDFQAFIEEFTDIFNCTEIPQPNILMQAAYKIAIQNLVRDCKKKYNNYITRRRQGRRCLTNSFMLKVHKHAMDEAIKQFRSSIKLVPIDLVKSAEEDLIFNIKEDFDPIDNYNSKMREQMMQETVQKALHSYEEFMNEELENDDHFLEENMLIERSLVAKSDSRYNFKETFEYEEDKKEQEKIDLYLENTLQNAENQLLSKNRDRIAEAEQRMTKLINSISQGYNDDMKDKVEKNPMMSKTMFHDLDKVISKQSLDKFQRLKTVFSKIFVDRYQKNLENALATSFEDVEKTFNNKVEEHKSEAETLLKTIIKKYQTEMTENFVFDLDLDLRHRTILKEIKNSLLTTNPFQGSADHSDSFVKRVLERLCAMYPSVAAEIDQKKKCCEESYQKAIANAVNNYQNEMNTFITNGFPTQEDLDQCHKLCVQDAVNIFNNAYKIGIHPTPEKYLESLETIIERKLEKLSEQISVKWKQAVAETKNNVHEALETYLAEMINNLELTADYRELERLHAEAQKKVIDQFLLKTSPELQHSGFIDPYVQELKSKIKTKFEGEIKLVFQLKLKEIQHATADAIKEIQKHYREEMEKSFINKLFMKPKELEKLHDKLSKQAIKKCCDEALLSQINAKNLNDALQAALQEYKDTNDMNTPMNPAIGIDLGTTYSCVSVYLNGEVRTIPNAQGKNTTPSYVCYNSEGYSDSVGEPAKSKAYVNSENTIYDAKRIIGRKWDDEMLQNDRKYWAFKVVKEQEVPKIEINGTKFDPEQISAEILKEMRVRAEKYLNCTVENAVITVPAYFTDGQRQATVDAGHIAGLKVLNILNEPVAAAISYKLQYGDDQSRHVLIFDLGGGTFDVAVLKMNKGEIKTLSVEGDTHLGGEDFDQNIMKHCVKEFKQQHGIDLMLVKDDSRLAQREVSRRLKRLQLECERKKIELSACRAVEICVDGIWNDNGLCRDLTVPFTRVTFEELNKELFQKTIQIVEKCLVSAGVEKTEIDDIVLVGGSTRIPKVQELLRLHFDGKELNIKINPDEAVSYGAAVDAAIHNGQIEQKNTNFNQILDVTPMSLGVEVYGGDFSVIIPKSTSIPARINEQYRTAHNNQTSVQIMIYQGESSEAKENNLLGEFYLNGIPPADAGRETIDVTMEINLQGILHVTAVCSSTGGKGKITVVENKHRMGKEKIKRLLAEAKPGRTGTA